MAAHTQRGSVSVDAFQWLGGTIAGTTLPIWAKQLALHTPGDGSLNIPVGGATGTLRANATDWAVRVSTGYVSVMPNDAFVVLYS